jgi:GAF domain-containing protein
MTETSRDTRLLQTFAMLADTLVAGYDILELLQSLVESCRELLGNTAAGILLADGHGQLELMASTSEASRIVETMQLAAQSGPCIECYRTGRPVSVPVIADVPEKWGAFRDSALSQGFAATEAIPLRLRETTIGTLNLLRSEPGSPSELDTVAARAFADVATIGILHERSMRESEVLTQQLQLALNTRVIIEQAKGVVSYLSGVPIDEAFELIRSYARSHQLPLSTVAERLVRHELTLDDPS